MTFKYAALALDCGIPMSVLLEEPDEYIDAMCAVVNFRADLAEQKRSGNGWS